MYKSVIFVDFENLQQIEAGLIDSKTKVIVMVGLDQDTKAFEFAKNLFNNISTIELIKVNGRGPNALDIFIAFYIGRYFDSIKKSKIIICSKDADYDQLVKHLDGYGISIKRIGLVEKIAKQIVEIKETKQKKETPKSRAEMKTDDVEKII
jgi:hydrogenase maturation factor HypE